MLRILRSLAQGLRQSPTTNCSVSAFRAVPELARVMLRVGVMTNMRAAVFEQIEEAYELFGHQRDGVLKVAIRP